MWCLATSIGLALLVALLASAASAASLWSTEKGGLAVDHSTLDNLLTGKARSFEITLEGRPLVAEVEEIPPVNLGVARLRGRFQGQPESYFLLCRGKEQATVAVFGDGEKAAYKLGYSEGRPVLTAVRNMKHAPCPGGVIPDFKAVPARIAHSPTAVVGTADPDSHNKEAGVADDGSWPWIRPTRLTI